MNISHDEYKLLKKLYPKKVLHLIGYTAETLEKKNLIESIDVYLHDDPSKKTNKYSLTNDGVIAYEQYREKHIKYWIPIIISNLIALTSLIVSIIAIML